MGLLDVPPAYPTRVRITPSRLPNRESGPQNQPKANVAVFICAGAAASMGGMVPFRFIKFLPSVACCGVHADAITSVRDVAANARYFNIA